MRVTYRAEMLLLSREVLKQRLAEAGGNVSKAARDAGLNRTHFYQMLQRGCIARAPVRHGNWAALQ